MGTSGGGVRSEKDVPPKSISVAIYKAMDMAVVEEFHGFGAVRSSDPGGPILTFENRPQGLTAGDSIFMPCARVIM